MKYINLLPKEEQKEIRLEKMNSRLTNLFIWIFISLLVLALAFVIARLYLGSAMDRYSNLIEQQKQAVAKQENKEVKDQLLEFNSDLNNLVELNKHHARWSEVMIAFARLVPEDVSIDTFMADRLSGKISIMGFAKNRDSVLALRNNILDSEYFTNINFPLSNLTRPTDVSFKYTFYVKPEMLLEQVASPQKE
jgi:Tfp pilus assembly protein PilN